MKTPTIPGKHYIVRSKTGCTVTQETSPGKYITAIVPADEDTPVFAHAGKFNIDDEGAIVTEVFNSAPYQKLRLLGVVGGNDGLPAGYTRVAFLETPATGGCLINTRLNVSRDVALAACSGIINTEYVSFVCGANSYGDLNDGLGSRTLSGIILINRITSVLRQKVSWGQGGFYFEKLFDTKPHVWAVSAGRVTVDGEFVSQFEDEWLPAVSPAPIGIFGQINKKYTDAVTPEIITRSDGGGNSRCWWFRASSRGVSVDFVPAVDAAGRVGFWDRCSKTMFYTTTGVEPVAGLGSQRQIDALLSHLPDRTGQAVGTLQVRLAEVLQTPENLAALDAMVAKNWEITQAA